MADCFISYRRLPSAPVAAALQSNLESKYDIDAYVDVTRTDGTRVRFPERLMTAIADAPVFVCLLGERDGQHTLESEWVLKEIQQAYDLRKFCIPVFQESYRPLPDIPPAVDYLLGFDGVHILDQKNIMIEESVRQIADLIRPHRQKPYLRLVAVFGALLSLILLVMIALPTTVNNLGMDSTPAPTAGVAQNATEAPANDQNLSGFQQLQTTEAELTQSAGTQAAFDLTATEQFISNSNATATAEQFAATETAAYATLLALSATPTPRPSNTSVPPTLTNTPSPTLTRGLTNTPDPIQIAFTPVARNADWAPVERNFNRVAMVLVPAGCFDMGDSGEGGTQCFDEPFWIDKYEVTQADFTRLYGTQAQAPGFSGNNRPIERITWYEASNHCEFRNGLLPTEAEWEYAARGPDGLVYPWGNELITNNTVYSGNSNRQTADVGSRPGGVSWVGALDMSGNVLEWTRSEFRDYPYVSADGREKNNSNVQRVIRGGSWSFEDFALHTTFRLNYVPSATNFIIGFRCMRPVS